MSHLIKHITLAALFSIAHHGQCVPTDPAPTGGGIGGTGHSEDVPLEATSSLMASSCAKEHEIGHVRRHNPRDSRASVDSSLCLDQTISNASGQTASIRLGDASTIFAGENTKLHVTIRKISDVRQIISINLMQGAIRIRATNRLENSILQIANQANLIEMAYGDVEVVIPRRGGKNRLIDPKILLRVHHGTARLSTKQEDHDISATWVGMVIGDEEHSIIKLMKDGPKFGRHLPVVD